MIHPIKMNNVFFPQLISDKRMRGNSNAYLFEEFEPACLPEYEKKVNMFWKLLIKTFFLILKYVSLTGKGATCRLEVKLSS